MNIVMKASNDSGEKEIVVASISECQQRLIGKIMRVIKDDLPDDIELVSMEVLWDDLDHVSYDLDVLDYAVVEYLVTVDGPCLLPHAHISPEQVWFSYLKGASLFTTVSVWPSDLE